MLEETKVHFLKFCERPFCIRILFFVLLGLAGERWVLRVFVDYESKWDGDDEGIFGESGEVLGQNGE